ncbi:AAA family ATPase [Priestia aryabhattai]|uniref:AAA family ATPase n=1 Tax=Priestia aryabhattai TaxID=412384 RepID=UPI003B675B1F
MNISEVIITNFKNYIGEHCIKLNKKITVLYGENGYGKSSFFDAIEWALTGTINRFEKDSGFSVQDLINDNIIGEESNNCSVIVKINDIAIKRYISSGNVYAKLSGHYYYEDGEKKNLNITGKDKVEEVLKEILFKNSNSSNLINNMMRQSFILSQDQVTDFIVRDDPHERYKSIADIMGLRRVVNYTENINQFLSQLRTQIREVNEGIEKQTTIVNVVSDKGDSFENISKEFSEIVKHNTSVTHEQLIDKIQFYTKVNQSLIYENNSLNEHYKELEKLKFFSYEELYSEVRRLSSMKIKYYRHIGYVNSNLESLRNRLSKELKKEDSLKDYNNLLKQKYDIENEINIYKEESENSEIWNGNFTLEEVNRKITELQKETNILNFGLLNRPDYHASKDFFSKLFDTEQNNDKQFKTLLKKIKRKQRWFDLLSTQLASVGSNNGLANLIDSINEIYNYVLRMNMDKECPVCSTTVEGSLQMNISEKIKEYTIEMDLKSTKVKRLSNIITSLREEIQSSKNNLNKLKENIEKLEGDKRFYQKLRDNIVHQEGFAEEIINCTEADLQERLSTVRDNINQLIGIKKSLIHLSDLHKRKDIVLKQISENEREQARDFDESIKNYKNKIKRRETYVEDIKSKLETFESKLEHYKVLLNKTEKRKDTSEDFRKIIRKNQEKITEAQLILTDLKNLEQRYYQFQSNQELFSKVEKAQRAIKKGEKKKKVITKLISDLEKHIKEINSTFGEEAMEFLNKPHSIIQKYYRYMNPMTSSKYLRFLSDSKKEELQIKICDENNKSELNAKSTLSSGQLNVLAISIFLASNKSFNSNINFIGIDDPIQNMDDVNRFSICDMLTNMDRQLIFSTHDLAFLKLFIKKNEHISDNIQVYNFTSPLLKKENVNRIVFN